MRTVGRSSGSRDGPQAVHGAPYFGPLPLKICLRVKFRLRQPIDEFEALEGLDLLERPLEVFGVVGAEEKLAAGEEGRLDRPEKGPLDEAALVVLGLWPGVGKEQVDACDGLPGEQPFDGVEGLEAQHLQVGEAVLVTPAAQFSDPAEQPLHAEKSPLRMFLCHAEEK